MIIELKEDGRGPAKPPSCQSCVGWNWGSHGFMEKAEGPGTIWNGVLLVGEALGENEALVGRPFVGRAGLALSQMLQRSGLRREHFIIDNALRCFGSDTRVAANDLIGAYRRWYVGSWVTVTLSSGGVLSGTPNHPVLTPQGWVALGKLVKGGDLINGSAGEGVSGCYPDVQHGPTKIGEVFNTLSALWGSRRVICRDVDFHGDGFEAEVEIVGPNSLLGAMSEAPGGEHTVELVLEGTSHDTTGFKGYSPSFDRSPDPISRDGDTACSLMSCIKHGSFTGIVGSGPSSGHCQPSTSWGNTTCDDGLVQRTPTDTESSSKRFKTFPTVIGTDRIINVEFSRFSGHVYNLSTSSQQYTASGYVVHNCRPPDNKLAGQSYEQDVLRTCGVHLDRTIQQHSPRAIVPLGDVPLRRVLGYDRFAKGETLTKRRGFPEWSHRYNCWIIPTFHPSYIMRGNRHLTQVFLSDVEKAIRIAREGLRPFTANLLSDPGVETVERYVSEIERRVRNGEQISLAYDIETPYKSDELDEDDLEVDDPTYIILRIGFCWNDREAISLAWLPQYLPFIQRLLALSCRKLTWNGRYDTPRVLANGMAIGGEEWDLMWAWHLRRSDLPKGLAFVASMLLPDQLRWKHLASTEAGKYNALDALVTFRLEKPILDQLTETDLRVVFERHIVELDKILMAMSRRGVLVDTEWRTKLAQDVRLALDRQLTRALDVVPRDARRAKIFAKEPKDKEGLLCETHLKTVSVCPNCGELNPKKPHFRTLKKRVNPCGGLTPVLEQRDLPTWIRLSPWAPSNAQMRAYLELKGHKPQLDRKSKNPTFNEEAMKVLMRQHPEDALYPLIIDYRELETIASRYVGHIEDGKIVGGMPVGVDGKVHTTFLHNPSTLRLSSQGPNLQVMPRPEKLSPLKSRVKGMFIADPGYLLWEIDYSGIEAVLVGYFARSLKYIRLAKSGVHDYLNGHILYRAGRIKLADVPDPSWSDADLKASMKALKKAFPEERDVAKRTIHGSNYLMTPRRMWELYPETFKTMKQAASLQNLYLDEACPEVRKWQWETIERADNGASLRNPFGYIHYFFHVKEWFKHDGKWEWKPGEDAKRAVAFMPQSTAAVIIKEAMLRLRQRGLDSYLLLQVHDSLLGTALRGMVRKIIEEIAWEMSQPNLFLPLSVIGEEGFLSIDVESKLGFRWSEMEEV